MKRTISFALIIIALAAGASSAQAAPPRNLTLSQVKAAIGHYAGEVGMRVEQTHNQRAAEGELDGRRIVFAGASLTKCETYARGGSCRVQWRFSDEVECSQALGAQPGRPIRIIRLTALRCAETSNSEYGLSPSSNSSSTIDCHPCQDIRRPMNTVANRGQGLTRGPKR